ncbi:MAG: UDP-N-acetylglucosamine 2-epimerase (non-hydrolyzing) [Methanomicrobiales archaeon]|nr:UDP-N-acetylglucosamine 2-epimerase (non-hydrolyzing) [Methanomicrobiales archaeon]
MKIMTILGTRPEIIRLSCTIEKLDRECEHILVHTGQNYDPKLSDIFFKELRIREPDYYLGVQSSSTGEQIGRILVESERILQSEKPDRLLILGDTNSSLSAIIAKRMAIPVYHMEAGNRCFDDRVPEEVNRRIIDHCSDILMPYTERSRANLIQEGISSNRIFVVGNPINEVLERYKSDIEESKVLEALKLNPNEYFLVTMHRAENVDIPNRLKTLIQAINLLPEKYKRTVILSLHPHTRDRICRYGLIDNAGMIQYYDPFGFIDFVALEKNAYCVISDSGTVQEECCIMHVPNVTIRDVTERPETVECGSNILSGANPEAILRCVQCSLGQPPQWNIPPEYLKENVSSTVVKILMSHRVAS